MKIDEQLFDKNRIFVILAVLHRSGGWRDHLCDLSPRQHSSEETSQRWRAVDKTVSNSTGVGIEPKIVRADSDASIHCAKRADSSMM